MQHPDKIHRRAVTVTLAVLAASSACAGGLDRNGQPIAPLFEKGGYAEFSIATVQPSLKGIDTVGVPTGNIAGNIVPFSFSYKQDHDPQLSYAVIFDQPFGVDINYASPNAGGSVMLGGTVAHVKTQALTGLVRYKLDNGFSVHGGLRAEQASGHVALGGLGYGPLNGYRADLANHIGAGYVLGAVFEKPEIALRISGTYNSSIKHDFDTIENISPVASVTNLNTPQTFNLDVSTGIAEDTLVFGSIRWGDWSKFKMRPATFSLVTGGASLTNISNSTDYTLGIAHRFNSAWSGVASVGFGKKGATLVSPLSPSSSGRSLNLAAIYTHDVFRIMAGISHTTLGDADAETSGQARANFSGNKIIALGLRVGMGF